MKKAILFSLPFLFWQMLHAQNFERFDIPVEINGASLPSPWTGGLNAPQWSSVDLNNDGVLDLYAFDESGNQHLTFLNIGEPGESSYVFAPEYAINFPACEDYVLLRDYNQDGAMDIFTRVSFLNDPPTLFRGAYSGNILNFTQVEFTAPIIGGPGTGTVLPAIDDIDNDGDVDFLLLHPAIKRLAYYENLAVEMGYPLDSLVYVLEDDCWGKFEAGEDYFNSTGLYFCLSNDSENCSDQLCDISGNTAVYKTTLCTFDEDNDGDKEILFTTAAFPNVVKGKNGGFPSDAWITSQDTFFPSYDVPLSGASANFYLDANNDGVKDLISSPVETSYGPDRQVCFYKNTQSDESPVFELQQKDFLVEDMIDMGSGAHPAFVDYNADGLMDLVVGNQGRWKEDFEEDAFLWLFENTGTSSEPKFEMVDTNWLDFNQYSVVYSSSPSFSPTFGDLDNDGDPDLLVGDRNGILFFGENLAGIGNPMVFGDIQPLWQGINVGTYATPHIHDFNLDGLPDLVIGERNGTLNYLPNQGTLGSPIFHPDPNEAPNNNYFGKIVTQLPNGLSGYSSPTVLTCGDSTYIITGSELGHLEMYLVNPDSLDGGAFEVITEAMDSLRTGWNTHVAFADLNNDGFMEAVIGNQRGGMDMFATDIEMGCSFSSVHARPTRKVKVFPNPATDFIRLKLPESISVTSTISLFDPQGRLVEQRAFSTEQVIRVSHLPSGFYTVKLMDGEHVYVGRFVKQ